MKLIRNSDPVILTYTGLYVTPLDLLPEHVCIEDIAHALANQCRFSGHTSKLYTVAQHSVLVARLVPRHLAYDALLHDAAEAYLQDVARPLKEDAYFGQAYRGAETRAERVIAEVFGLIYPHPPEIKVADTQMLAAERRDLMPRNEDSTWEVTQDVFPPFTRVVPWTPERSRNAFMKRYLLLKARRDEG